VSEPLLEPDIVMSKVVAVPGEVEAGVAARVAARVIGRIPAGDGGLTGGVTAKTGGGEATPDEAGATAGPELGWAAGAIPPPPPVSGFGAAPDPGRANGALAEAIVIALAKRARSTANAGAAGGAGGSEIRGAVVTDPKPTGDLTALGAILGEATDGVPAEA